MSVSTTFCEEENDVRCLERCVDVDVDNHTSCACQCRHDENSCLPNHVSKTISTFKVEVSYCDHG
jgi:hypothetical protein